MRSVVVVAGPTATGKTKLGIELAGLFNGEIVSADSMQVYEGMDIGTAKATKEQLAIVPHHMIDVAEPWEDYSAARYVEQATLCCDDILARDKLPVIVGGTGLYIDSLILGRDFAETDRDEQLRDTLGAEYDVIGGEAMLKRLKEFDPERAALLSPADKKRIVRATEVFLLTGESISEHDRRTRALPPRYDAVKIVLSYADRAILYKSIDERVDAMEERGLFQEVADLLSAGLSPECTAMQAIGYKEAAKAISGELTKPQALEQIKQASRRLAKRQLTWFSRDSQAMWIRWESQPDFVLARRLSTEFLHSRGIS